MKRISSLFDFIHKGWIRLGLRQKIALSIFVFSIIPILIIAGILVESLYNNRISDELREFKEQMAVSRQKIVKQIENTEEMMNFIVNNGDITRFILLHNDEDNIQLVMWSYNKIEQILNAMMTNSKKNLSIYVFNDFLTASSDYLQYYTQMSTILKQLFYEMENDTNNWIIDTDNKTLSVCRKINPYNNSRALIKLDVPITALAKEFENVLIPDHSFLIFLSDDDYYVLNKTMETDVVETAIERYFRELNAGNYYLIENDLGVDNQKVLLFLSKDAIKDKYTRILFLIILVTILIVVIVFLSIKVTSTLLTKRLNMLVRELGRGIDELAAKGSFPEIGGSDEISRIETKIRELIQRVVNYYRTITKYEIDNKSLEVTLLQERINPHFLYNTLSAVKHAYNDASLNELIDSMITYYRIALSKGENIIFIEKEVEMIERYISIQKFAFDSDFSYSIELQDEIRQCYILKQLLQPVVENAILHGINSLESGGHLSIYCSEDPENKNKIVFKIRDNGIGMPYEKKQNIEKNNDASANGYGLRNVQERIRLNYGEEYGTIIESNHRKGTTVIITIPKKKNKLEHRSKIKKAISP